MQIVFDQKAGFSAALYLFWRINLLQSGYKLCHGILPAVPQQLDPRGLPYRFNGFPCFFINLIDKSHSQRHSCRAVAGKHHSCFGREKTRKEAAPSACSHPFRVFQNSRLFNSRRLFGLKKLCVAQKGIAVHLSTFSIPKKLTKLGSQLSKSHRRENHL